MERESKGERPADRLEPEDAKPADDAPSDRDLKPSSDTERVVEEEGRDRPEAGS